MPSLRAALVLVFDDIAASEHSVEKRWDCLVAGAEHVKRQIEQWLCASRPDAETNISMSEIGAETAWFRRASFNTDGTRMLEEKSSSTPQRAGGMPSASNDLSSPLVKVSGWTPCNGSAYLKAKRIQQNQQQDHQESPSRTIRYTPNNIPRDHQALFAGDIKNLHHDNLFRLAKYWTIGQIATKVNAAHGEEVINQKTLSNRLSRDIGTMAERDGKPRETLLQELRAAQKTNGVPINGRKSTAEDASSPTKPVSSTKRKQRVNPDFIPGLRDRDGDFDMDDLSSSPTRASELGVGLLDEEVPDSDEEEADLAREEAELNNPTPAKPKATVLAFIVGSVSNNAKAVIIDTDIMTDVDDVGALAVANVLHNCGLCDLRGVMVNTYSKYGALAASVVNTHFGNGDVPIAAVKPLTNETFFDQRTFLLSDYASKLAYNFPRTLEDAEQTPEPVELYRSILESASNNSVTIVSVGFLNNLAALIDTADAPALLASKVAELVVMGGQYPSGWEFNFGGVDPASTTKVLKDWPKNIPITYSGFELGKDIMSGDGLKQHAPPDSPVLAAYEWYNGRCSTMRESWDPLTVLYSILGLDEYDVLGLKSPFVYANDYGYNSITATNASNAWINDSSVTNQHWLKLADGVSNTSVAGLLTQLYAHDPISLSCMNHAAHTDL